MTDITTNNGHADFATAKSRMPAVEYGAFKPDPTVTYAVRDVISGIQNIVDEQKRDLDQRDNMIALLRDENETMREERDFYLRKSVALAQQMKSISQLCEEGRRLAEAADKLEREAALK